MSDLKANVIESFGDLIEKGVKGAGRLYTFYIPSYTQERRIHHVLGYC